MALRYPPECRSHRNSPSQYLRHPPKLNRARTTRISPHNKVLPAFSFYEREKNDLPPFFAASALIGETLYANISHAALTLYSEAAAYALSKGIILADTKFEFGLIGDELILIDELLTPDSSRYWPVEGYQLGVTPPSFDKQYLRDWLVRSGFKKGLEKGVDGTGWTIADDVVQGTRQRYTDVVDMLVG